MEQDPGEQEAGVRHSGCLVKHQDHLALAEDLALAVDLAEVVVEALEDGGHILILTRICQPLLMGWGIPIMEWGMLRHTELVFL